MSYLFACKGCKSIKRYEMQKSIWGHDLFNDTRMRISTKGNYEEETKVDFDKNVVNYILR